MTEDVQAKLLGLLKGPYSSLTLSYNDNGSNYQTVAQSDDDEQSGGNPFYEWVSEEERTKAREQNAIWTLQWYPHTPVGFNCIAASSLTAIMEHLGGEHD
jgi:hypothetical protein